MAVQKKKKPKPSIVKDILCSSYFQCCESEQKLLFRECFKHPCKGRNKFFCEPMEERKRGRTQPRVGWISRFAFLPWLSASCVCVSGDTTLISLCGKTTAELQSWRLPLNRRWSPSDLHLALDTAAFHKMTLRELSAFMYPTLNLKLGCDFTSNCTEMQWLQWVVCNFFC